jgi:hypothetical protein
MMPRVTIKCWITPLGCACIVSMVIAIMLVMMLVGDDA